MSFTVESASKKALRLRIGLTGPSGAGKTYSALQLAAGLAQWDKIGIIDTENRSSEYYADFGPWKIVPFDPPYTVERYIQALHAAERSGMEVIAIDSLTHAWAGTGGLMEVLDKMAGTNRFQNFAAITPQYERLLNAIRLSPAHVICCFRSKTESAMVTENGRQVVKNMGMQPIFRPGWEYEFGQVFDIDADHNSRPTKDRSNLFGQWGPDPMTPDVGERLLKWASSGAAVEEPWDKERATGLSELLTDTLNDLPAELHQGYKDRFNEGWKAKSIETCRNVVTEACAEQERLTGGE